MGNDGGSIPKRRELVKNAARAPTVSELKATVLESQGHAWAHCALSGDRLDPDALVSDWKGRLYNYESVLKGLMPADGPALDVSPASLGIKSLRDIVRLKVSKEEKRWVCPLSMKELGPATKSVYLVPCGHVFAEVAMTEVQEETCPECNEAFTAENIIAILPTNEKDIQRLEERMESLRNRGLTHTLKKDKSEKKKKRKGDELEGSREDNTNGNKSKQEKKTKTSDSRVAGINNEFAASLTAKVLAEQDERNKRRKLQAEAAR
ncbi:hypothetical protein NLU13_3799 [Sarocladium strictum]|uniref:Replication termination factor 2 n=1 Tax=Sarocladium strictum TaxID=5046 RepID=A0AA39GJ31_SARSR|nr:hypothetical protein NLU13_3799 [Sarocladium strictum]